MAFRVCFVCTGNICRSPTAEVVFTQFAADAGLADLVRADSAGTANWHAGKDMDARSRRALEAAGYRPRRHVAKQFTAADFATRDLIVALDARHRGILRSMAERAAGADRDRVVLLRSYDATSRRADLDVPDPFYDDADGFALVLAQIERACAGLVAELSANG
jgi:protein-tyrosine phosphatase